MQKIDKIPNVRVLFPDAHHFKEFLVNFDDTGKIVTEVKRLLLEHKVFGGKDLSDEFPELGQNALFCITEVHSQADIDYLVEVLAEVTK